ncbi:hypothetical protein GWG54_16265 [Natronococcus sp. JC468]|uniref:DUF7344 domain-containing protein n=1 Tax=Natronococcus sp. JC468 TaxID=1961921 RepID=UPI00143BB9A4|nr:hypothetical protein [Natronococcus sp. JC468]NKE37342.1 hypothetical protein [Natronococcus sp. JC468]
MDTHEAFAVLSDSDRQHVLEELLETEGRTTVGVLADQLAARRKNRADELDREHAEVRLVHNHLPRLADHGVIEYDRESGEVVLVDASDLEPYLTDPVRKRRIPIDE